jgi:hypothetical protein
LILNNSEIRKWRVFVQGCRLFVECFGIIWPVLVLSSGLGIAAAWSQLSAPVDANTSLATILVVTVVSTYLNVIVTLVCFNHLRQKHVTVGAVASLALAKLPVLMVVLFITNGVLALIMIVVGVLGQLLFVVPELVLFGMVLGLLLLAIPGLILMATLLPAATLFIIRPMGLIEAIRKSHRLVRGYWLRTANIYALYIILWVVLLLPLIAPIFLVDIDGLTLMSQVSLLLTLVTPWLLAGFAALNLVLCHDLLIRQERRSLVEFASSS